MNLQDQRARCLQMAFELGGKPEAVLSAAQQLLDFITAGEAADAQTTSDAADALTAAAEQPAEAPSAGETAAETVTDPITACGTALVIPEGGDLASATPSMAAAAATVVVVPESEEAAAAETAEHTASPEAVETAVEAAGEPPSTEADKRAGAEAEATGETAGEAAAPSESADLVTAPETEDVALGKPDQAETQPIEAAPDCATSECETAASASDGIGEVAENVEVTPAEVAHIPGLAAAPEPEGETEAASAV